MKVLKNTVLVTAMAMSFAVCGPASAQGKDLKVGLLLPFSQVFAVYGEAIKEGFDLAIEEAGGQVAGRKIVVLKEDNKEDPKVSLQMVRRYTKDDNVDFIVGPIASHVVGAIRDEVHRSKTFLLVANAGNNEITGKNCSPYIVRTSFSNWQVNHSMGQYAAENIGKSALTVSANYDSGREQAGAFRQGFIEKGGKAPLEEWPALGTADFAPIITSIRAKQAEVDMVFPSLTVMESLTLAARPPANGATGWTLERVLDVFPRLGERRRNRSDALSGGEQQMLAIGRALLTNPRLLILDEPTEGLAPLIVYEIQSVLCSLRGSGMALIVVDQNLDTVFNVADEIAVMSRGAVVAQGSSATLRADQALLNHYLGV